MPQNSLYNTLRSWMLHKYPPEKVITAQDAVRIVGDLVTLMQGIQEVQDGIILPDTKGQIITHNGTDVVLKDVAPTGRIAYSDSSAPDGWLWEDPSILGFMTGLLVRLNGTGVGTRPAINFLNGGGITWTITDDGVNDEVEVSGTAHLTSKSSSDQTTATGAMVDITNVGLSIAANQLIYFRAVVHVGTSANNGVRYAVTIPTGATMKVMFMAETTGAIGQGPSQWITTSGSQTTAVNAIISAAQNAVFEGWVQASSTAGTIQIQGRTVNAANTVTFYSGSFITGHLAN